MIGYFQWQLWLGPRWLLTFFVTLQRALWRFFSVPTMVRTLLAPWRQDQLSLRQPGFTNIIKAAAFNGISRVIGAIVRSAMITSFGFTTAFLTLSFAIVLAIFVAWPLLTAWFLFAGVVRLVSV